MRLGRRTEGASRSRVGDEAAAAAAAGERGRCPSRRSGGTPPRRSRRTVLALSAGGGLRGRGRWPTKYARTAALRSTSASASHFTRKPVPRGAKKIPAFANYDLHNFFVFLTKHHQLVYAVWICRLVDIQSAFYISINLKPTDIKRFVLLHLTDRYRGKETAVMEISAFDFRGMYYAASGPWIGWFMCTVTLCGAVKF
jgi:hypothetical protein